MSLGLPSWKKLTLGAIERIASAHPSVKPYAELLESDEISCLDALGHLEKHKTLILDHVTEILKIDKNQEFSLQKALLSLSKKIITSNYDKAFEFAAEDQLDVVLNSSDYKLSQLSSKKAYIFKIHNDIDSTDSCVLFRTQYESLYHNKSAFINEFVKLFTDKVILFVGFSLTDPYVNEILSGITELYKHFNREHFILTHDHTFDPTKFSNKIIPISLKSLDELLPKIKELTSCKDGSQERVSSSLLNSLPLSAIDHLIRISILHARPIDKDFDVKDDLLVDNLSKFHVEIDVNTFNLSNLQNLEYSSQLFLFTKNIKNKFILEDEYLKSSQHTLDEIDENIPAPELRCVVIFYEGEEYLPSRDIKTRRPYILINITPSKLKGTLSKFIYHYFTKLELPRNIENSVFLNVDHMRFEKLSRGKSVRLKFIPNISRHLDIKMLNKFVGRRTDLEVLIRKLVDLKYENKILTIKGSGGIGKTTLVAKTAIEVAERQYYEKGVFFIPCQSIMSLENFKYEVSQCFDLTSSIRLEEQIRENFIEKDRLLILDNFETLLNINDSEEILKLVSIICDYCCLVTTSRQILNFDFEDVYDIRNLTTDEALQLFKSLYPCVSSNQESVLRNDIVENLLNNNPLAIKLIAKGLPPNKDLDVLRRELEGNIFKYDDIERIFERPEDINIEKSNSLFHSINYSYQRLSETEKFAFEILSIFPDGIHLENLKKFSNGQKKTKYRIDDKEIKSLDNKSLLENRNNHLRLQSIISRFAEHQFNKREHEIKVELFTLAFEYNKFILSFLSSDRYFKSDSSLRLLDQHSNNLLKVIEFIELSDTDKVDKIDFIDDASDVFIYTNQPDQFLKVVKSKKEYFSDIDNAPLLIDLLEIHTLYWSRKFESTFSRLQKIFPFDRLNTLNLNNKIERSLFFNSLPVYECEGYSYEIIELLIAKDFYNVKIEHKLFKLGYIEESYKLIHDLSLEEDFSTLEIKNVSEDVDAKYIQEYVNSLYKKKVLEIVQSTYVLSRHIDISESALRKLVVSNPYTRGLITIMNIPNLEDLSEIKKNYEDAIADLKHIKYYWIEAILEFCKYLKSVRDEDFKKWFELGMNSAKEYRFGYLIFLFDNIDGTAGVLEFSQEYYVEKYVQINGLLPYIKKYTKKRQERKK